jgi:hypothetical protein
MSGARVRAAWSSARWNARLLRSIKAMGRKWRSERGGAA